MAKIRDRWTSDAICEEALLELKQLAEKNKNNLSDADLRGADLSGANLCDADLCDADLSDANLCGANLRGADLSGANLRGANLCGANLRGADLCGANLRDADLRGAKNIEKLEWTNQAKQQILFIFSYQPKSEVEGLRNKIIEGKINGTQYQGDCCCLVGSLGNDKAVSCIPYYTKGLHNIAEQLFYQIREGDTPETNVFSKIALELCDEFLSSKE